MVSKCLNIEHKAIYMNNNYVRFDHHYHAAFDFSPRWMRVQRYSANTNVLQAIVDTALAKKIDICAIVTEDFGDKESGGRLIKQASIHNKFARLKDMALNLPASYKHNCDGPVITVEKDGRSTYILSAQTPLVRDNGYRIDHLVIGVDAYSLIPNLMSLVETNSWINEEYGRENVIRVAEHVGLKEHFALSQERFLSEFLEGNYDALEFNAQMINPLNPHAGRYKIPSIGKKLRAANRGLNESNEAFAREHKVPFIAGSDGHRIEHLGIAYTEFNAGRIDTSSGAGLVHSIKQAIAKRQFGIHRGYASILQWCQWLTEFVIGHGFKLPSSSLTAGHQPEVFIDS